jgi:hypothetical protein
MRIRSERECRMRRNKSVIAPVFMFTFTFLALSITCCRGREEGPARPVQNLRTLAKLYGYLRYFHPSDEAARIDWDALAIYASAKVKDAPDSKTLKSALEEIFRPVAPSMALYFKGETPEAPTPRELSPEVASKLVSWQHMGLGTGAQGSVYRSVRLNRPSEEGGQATLTQGIDAAEHAGKTVTMKAWVSASPGDMNSRVQLWLRVDGRSGPKFFDNMMNRPIRTPDWAEYTITGPVADDAQRITFGALIFGRGRFLVDGFRFSMTDASGQEATVAVPNAGFEEGKAGAIPRPWNIRGSSLEIRVQEDDVREGKRALVFSTKVEETATPLFEKRAPADGVIDKEIGQGLRVRAPLTLETDEEGTIPRAEAEDWDGLREALERLAQGPLGAGDEDVRLGDVVIAWNVFQHFYPYFDVVEADWDDVLTRSFERALSDETEEEFLRTLNRLTAELDDGHAGVYHALQNNFRRPPFRAEWIENRLVVTVSRDESFKPGDVILSVDGKNAEDILREEEEFLSGSPQWKRWRSTGMFFYGPAGPAFVAKIRRGREVLEVPFERTSPEIASAPPALSPVDTLEDGVVYVDLSRAPFKDIYARIEDLAGARGVVFDLRGYPNGNHQIISYLLSEPVTAKWMKIPLIVLPDRVGWTYREAGWPLVTGKPRIGGRVVFLTDGRAISYAESFMGHIEAYKLGEIVGGPTAGANGNVNPFTLPGGFRVAWTGMKVVKHDGSQLHTIGILPTVPCERTIAGVAAGRDELLEKAIEIINR